MRLLSRRILFVCLLVNLWHYCTIASEWPTELDAGGVQTSPLCNVPREIVQHIASFLPNVSPMARSDIQALRLSCKFLHNTVTIPGKVINIGNSCGNETIKDRLKMLLFCIKTVINRQGNNHIAIGCSLSGANEDMDIFKIFLQKCSSPDIAMYIKQLDIGYSELSYIPEEITGLTSLNRLCIDGNKINHFDRLRPITSLPQLTYLVIHDMDLEEIGPEILRLSNLECLCMGFNKLKRKDLELAIQLPNLKKIYFQKTNIKKEDVDYLKSKYPYLRDLLSISNL